MTDIYRAQENIVVAGKYSSAWENLRTKAKTQGVLWSIGIIYQWFIEPS